MQVNQGATSKNYYGRNIVCSTPSMSFTPFYTGNDSQSEAYSISQGWGFQMSFMVPLGNEYHESCKALVQRNIQRADAETLKVNYDRELIRFNQCAKLYSTGYMINPASPMFGLCGDIISIDSYVLRNQESFVKPSPPSSEP